MRVFAYDPHVDAAMQQEGVELVSDLDALLSRSNVLSLHVPLTPATRLLIGGAQLSKLPVGAILVNTARGDGVDEGDRTRVVQGKSVSVRVALGGRRIYRKNN